VSAATATPVEPGAGPWARWENEHRSVALRNLPFPVLYACALLVLATPAADATDPRLVLLSAALVAAALVLTGVASARTLPPGAAALVPLLELAAVGPLRATTGGGASLFTALVIPPVIALAVDRRRRGVAVAVLATAAVLVVPQWLGGMVTTVPDLVRAVFTPAALGVAALTVNELYRRLSDRLETVGELQEQQTDLLAQVEMRAAELELLSRRLAGANETLGSVIDAVTEQAIVSCDLAGVVRVWNPGAEKMLRAQRGDVVRRRSVTSLHLPAELEAARTAHPDGAHLSSFDALVAGAATHGSEVRDWTWVREDGSELTVELAVTPRRDGSGALAGYTLVATDMTAARAADRLRDEFTSLISHELRTPLSSILGYLELVLDDPDEVLTDEQRQYLATVDRNAHRLLRLVGDLLFTAQVEAGRFTLRSAEVDLSAVVRAAVDTSRVAATAAGVTLETDVLPGLVITGDADRLGQVCDNLLSNAVKFTPRGGRVRIALDTYRRADGPVAALTVADTGIGVPADEQGALFTRFFRASTARRHAVSGVGLGLTITQAITTAHGGTMDLQSEPGRGTTFTVVLPVVGTPATAGTRR